MSIVPQNAPTTADGRTQDRLADLERRLRVLERGVPRIQTFTGAPTATVRSGTPGLQTDTPRLWLNVGGTWRFTTLT